MGYMLLSTIFFCFAGSFIASIFTEVYSRLVYQVFLLSHTSIYFYDSVRTKMSSALLRQLRLWWDSFNYQTVLRLLYQQ
jgi:hypothetical protein